MYSILVLNYDSVRNAYGAVVGGAVRHIQGRWCDLEFVAHQAIHPSGVGDISSALNNDDPSQKAFGARL
ncbi:hypothetical protein KIN20_020278 [Parelaphostrongylus tenuis]|uniref:Uncharacterized protein n=1 Tax=Parelaphostrongylus tenuis TaxID=148309 RepID=A0AAD5MM74_PARTN|nr:hypothetical protein KIN20_020278 [Parelaphostrongylus tenuis]